MFCWIPINCTIYAPTFIHPFFARSSTTFNLGSNCRTKLISYSNVRLERREIPHTRGPTKFTEIPEFISTIIITLDSLTRIRFMLINQISKIQLCLSPTQILDDFYTSPPQARSPSYMLSVYNFSCPLRVDFCSLEVAINVQLKWCRVWKMMCLLFVGLVSLRRPLHHGRQYLVLDWIWPQWVMCN